MTAKTITWNSVRDQILTNPEVIEVKQMRSNL
jgi:hypothetical protein